MCGSITGTKSIFYVHLLARFNIGSEAIEKHIDISHDTREKILKIMSDTTGKRS
jgi:hypothetical protein